MDQRENRSPAVSSPGTYKSRNGSAMGLSHLQHPAMDTSLLEAETGEDAGKVTVEMQKEGRSQSEHERSPRLEGGRHAFSVTAALLANFATDGRSACVMQSAH